MICKTLAIAILSIFPLLVVGQVRSDPTPQKKVSIKERAQGQTIWMEKKLSLTIDQYSLVNEINYKYEFKNDSLEKIKNIHIKKEGKMMIKDDRDIALKSVLNEEQFKKYIEFKEKKIPADEKRSPFSTIY